MSRCEPLETTGGKSGANFLISSDKKYLLKQINKAEAAWFKADGDSFFWYLSRTLFPETWNANSKGSGSRATVVPSLLTQIYGIFTVSANSKKAKWKKTFMVLRNLKHNFGHANALTFDLKGVGRNRRIAEKVDVERGAAAVPAGSSGAWPPSGAGEVAGLPESSGVRDDGAKGGASVRNEPREDD